MGIGCGSGIIWWPSIFRSWIGTMSNRSRRLWRSSVGVWTHRRSRVWSIRDLSRWFLEVSGGDWRSVSVSEWETGFKDGRLRPQCGTEWEDFPECDSGHFQERKSGSSVCLVPGGFACLDPESGFYRLLHG